MNDFTHLDQKGGVRMVDIRDKNVTVRTALAQGKIYMQPDTFEKISNNSISKGNVLETARIAGIMAAKRTSLLIPMCHPLCITHAKIDFESDSSTNSIKIIAVVSLKGQTGVEMEALTAVSIAALTIYDMCKAIDREMIISDIFLLQKTGGKSGTFTRKESC